MDAINLTVAAWLLTVLSNHNKPEVVKAWAEEWGKAKGGTAHFAYTLLILAIIGGNIHYGLNG